MVFDFGQMIPRNRYKLMVSTITPRPIAWVVSQDTQGVLNAAPFSFFNAFAGDPPIIGIGISHRSSGQEKDTRANIAETGQFVVNLVSEETAQAMNVTSIDFDPQINEIEEAGLTTLPSVRVKPPRIAESPVNMECVLHQIVELGPTSSLILGKILAMHVRDDVIIDAESAYIDTPKLKLIARMHGTGWYARGPELFEMKRIPVAEWKRK
jgi:flavin reductase (DIM6/NTAB) family NADH-FMN oxidoreductase RutF